MVNYDGYTLSPDSAQANKKSGHVALITYTETVLQNLDFSTKGRGSARQRQRRANALFPILTPDVAGTHSGVWS